MKNKEIFNFYKQTSLYTDLGLYKDFAKQLTDDINELCILQRMQIIHPVSVNKEDIISHKNKDTNLYVTRLKYEDDLFPTAISMISELLRKDKNYSINRKLEDQIHVTCRGQAILLASILKAKGYSARVRSGFAPYIKNDGVNYDHWITEYYSEDKDRWVLVDADMHGTSYGINFDLNDIPRDKFIFGALAYLGMRNNKYKDEEIYYDSDPATLGLKAALRSLFYDFHSLMNDEKLLEIWNKESKFRIMSGALNS